jgi:hypothetical protein
MAQLVVHVFPVILEVGNALRAPPSTSGSLRGPTRKDELGEYNTDWLCNRRERSARTDHRVGLSQPHLCLPIAPRSGIGAGVMAH